MISRDTLRNRVERCVALAAALPSGPVQKALNELMREYLRDIEALQRLEMHREQGSKRSVRYRTEVARSNLSRTARRRRLATSARPGASGGVGDAGAMEP